MARNYSNVAESTTLSGSINNSATTIAVGSTTGYPSAPFTIIIDPGLATEELVEVGGVAGTNFTSCTRGVDGTPAQSHSASAVVVHGTSARDYREPQDHIAASTNVHGLAGGAAVVGTTSTQTLTNKTLTSPTINTPAMTGGTWTSPSLPGTLTGLTLATPSITNPTITSGGSWAGSPTINTPTITVPTIADLTNMQHTHTGASSGGSINTSTTFNSLFGSSSSDALNSGSWTSVAGGTISYTSPSSWGTNAKKLVASFSSEYVQYDGSPSGLKRLLLRFVVDGSTYYPSSSGANMYVVADSSLGQFYGFTYQFATPLPTTSASHSLAVQLQLPSVNGAVTSPQLWAYVI